MVPCTYVCVRTHRDHNSTSIVIFNPPPLYFLKLGLSLNLEFTNFARQAGRQAQGIIILRFQACTTDLAVGAGDLNSNSHACAVSIVLTDPSP